MTEKIPTSFRFTKDFIEFLGVTADELGISRTELIIRAVRAYCSKEEGCTTDNATVNEGRSDDEIQGSEWRELYYYERDKRAEDEAALRNELGEIRKSLQASQLMQGHELIGAVTETDNKAVNAIGKLGFRQRVRALFTGRVDYD